MYSCYIMQSDSESKENEENAEKKTEVEDAQVSKTDTADEHPQSS